jgi:HK97 family phage prohead protease
MTPKLLKQCHGAPIRLEMEEFDGSGRFEGWGTVYGVPIERFFGSIIMDPGMFRESILTKGSSGIRMLWQHDPDQPIGVYESIEEVEKGLRVAGRLLIDDSPKAREVYGFMKAQAIGGLSVGFGVQEERSDKTTGVVHYTRGDLWEVSAVTFPANSQAEIDNVHARLIEEIQAPKDLERILRDAGFSKRDATAIASHGFKGLRRRDADESEEIFAALQSFNQDMRKIIHDS